jgi:hypothetical protein
MSLSFSQLFASKQVNNAAADTLFTLPTSPANTVLRNGRIRFVNTTAGFVTIKAWAVPPAGATADANVMLPTTSVGVNGFVDVDVPMLPAGYSVQAQAGAAASITAHFLDGFLQS